MKKIIAFFVILECLSLSAQDYLIKTEWGQNDFTSFIPEFEDGTPFLTGCTTVAAAQVINYYGFLPQYDFRYSIEVYSEGTHSFPAGAEEIKHNGYSLWTGMYHCSGFTANTDSLIAAIFFSQASAVQTGATSTSPFSLFGCFNNHYSYDVEAYVTDQYSDAAEAIYCKIVTTAEQKEIVKKAIADGHPVIVNGKDHSFIMDGYNPDGDLFHFNYGWGPGSNGWSAYDSWADGRYSVFIPVPNGTKVTMPELVEGDGTVFHIRNVETGKERTGRLEYSWDGAQSLVVRSDGDSVKFVTEGTYEMWFELPDHSIIAPSLPVNRKVVADKQTSITSYSFINRPAVLTFEGTGFEFQLDIFYDTSFGYISIMMTEIISSAMLDKARMEIVCNGDTFPLYNHGNAYTPAYYYTDPIAVKAGSTIEWLFYFNGIPWGAENYYAQGEHEFSMGEGRVLMVQPSQAQFSNCYCARFVTDYGMFSTSELGTIGYLGCENVLKFKAPTELYVFNGGLYDVYTGPISSLEKITPETIYIGFSYLDAPYIFICNINPDQTGVKGIPALDDVPSYDLLGRPAKTGLIVRDGKVMFVR